MPQHALWRLIRAVLLIPDDVQRAVVVIGGRQVQPRVVPQRIDHCTDFRLRAINPARALGQRFVIADPTVALLIITVHDHRDFVAGGIVANDIREVSCRIDDHRAGPRCAIVAPVPKDSGRTIDVFRERKHMLGT